MVVMRNVFQLKFGKAREAVAIMKEQVAQLQQQVGREVQAKLLTDMTGDFYTVVLELTCPSLGWFEQNGAKIMGDPQWQATYQKLVPLVESGRREVFNVVEVGSAARA